MSTRQVVLAEYFCTEQSILLYGARADWDQPQVVEIPWPLADLRQQVAAQFGAQPAAAGAQPSTAFARVRQLDLAAWQARFAPLAQPLAAWAAPGDILYLVPHDALHYVPLHALAVEGGILLERNPLVYTPSASVLPYCQARRTGRRDRALILGDSAPEPGLALPFAREEALELASLFGTQAVLGADARKSLLRDRLAHERDRLDVLHLACHGIFNARQPLRSGILLAPEPAPAAASEWQMHGLPASRWLTAEDFFGLDLRANLVTFSACESGVSQVRPGDELFGLMRAILYAGTPSVVMSLWSVDDVSTGLLMAHFYQRLRAGDTKVEALQKAALYLRSLTAGQALAYYQNQLDQLGPAADAPRQAALQAARRSINSKLAAAETTAGRPLGLDEPIFKHPAYWAPFILAGDWK